MNLSSIIIDVQGIDQTKNELTYSNHVVLFFLFYPTHYKDLFICYYIGIAYSDLIIGAFFK